MNDNKIDEAFWKWRDGLSDGQETLLRRFTEMEGDPVELLSVAFHAGWEDASKQFEKV